MTKFSGEVYKLPEQKCFSVGENRKSVVQNKKKNSSLGNSVVLLGRHFGSLYVRDLAFQPMTCYVT